MTLCVSKREIICLIENGMSIKKTPNVNKSRNYVYIG